MKEKELYQEWLNKVTDQELLDELKSISSDDEIIDRFYQELEFGTGGLRGVLGAGTNRVNIYTIRKITMGLVNHILKNCPKPHKLAISYDSRIKSDVFAKCVAEVCAFHNIDVYIYDELMPVPSLSFATKRLGCSYGVMITASHNPSIYNGYKVYGSDGNQITLEEANSIYNEIKKIDPFTVNHSSFFCELNNHIHYIDETIREEYLSSTLSLSLLDKQIERNAKIVYTPLNGSGLKCVKEVLKRDGFNNIYVVSEQEQPNGLFPTCKYPNPEIKEALELAIQLAKKTDSDLVLATDPDCDRVGIAVKKDGDYILLTGNETGVLLFDFLCKMKNEHGTMPLNPIAVKTIVTTDMMFEIAKKYNVEVIDVLTGFKFIGEVICNLEKNNEVERYIYGMEESYGYLTRTDVRDKDGVNACLLIAEMYQYYTSKGINLYDQLINLYSEFGFFYASLKSYNFQGVSGKDTMNKIMEDIHNGALSKLLPSTVVKTYDYLNGISTTNMGVIEKIDLPKSDVVKLILSDKTSLVVRPSGTEPKIKFYFTTVLDKLEESIKLCNEYIDIVNRFVELYK